MRRSCREVLPLLTPSKSTCFSGESHLPVQRPIEREIKLGRFEPFDPRKINQPIKPATASKPMPITRKRFRLKPVAGVTTPSCFGGVVASTFAVG